MRPKSSLIYNLKSVPWVLTADSGVDRSDMTFALGGLAPVPLLFLLGVIVDDEHKTILIDVTPFFPPAGIRAEPRCCA